MKNLIVAAAVFSFPGMLLAQETAVIEQMQMPAWVVSDGERFALSPDTEIRAGDEIVTGDTGRVLAYLPDGADLKLGSNARFIVRALARVEEIAERVEQEVSDQVSEMVGETQSTIVEAAQEAVQETSEAVVRGLFEIPEGAFRYTTRAALAFLKRDIIVKVGFSTVGIRGTDFWGRSDEVLDTVCLIEGAIAVQKEAMAIVEMDQPLTFFRAPKAGVPEPVAPVDADQLAEWAASVDIESGSGVLTAEGVWSVYLGAFRVRTSAESMAGHLDTLGYPARVVVASSDGALYRVAVEGFASYPDATSFIETAEEQLEISGAWLARI